MKNELGDTVDFWKVIWELRDEMRHQIGYPIVPRDALMPVDGGISSLKFLVREAYQEGL